METLERLSATPDAAWYRVGGERQGRVERYVVTTPRTRAICNRPEVLGLAFNQHLEGAMAAALAAAPFRDLVAGHPEERVCVVNFLRGGLNFELRRALHAAYGFNRHSSAFMSSQRQRVSGRWQVQEDMYRKLDIPKDAVLLAGDVVATGVTLGHGFEVIADHVDRIGSSLRGLVLFTIGCHKAEKILEPLHERFGRAFPGYERTVLVYLEAKFRLVDSKLAQELRVGISGTDLIRRGALLAPELELSQYDAPAHILERCGIYDAGSRAFDVPHYLADVRDYWQKVAGFAADGWTLAEALRERWPAPEYDADRPTFRAAKRAAWSGVDDAFLDALYERQAAFRAAPGLATAQALRDLAAERLATLA
jgi:hypothetical protein